MLRKLLIATLVVAFGALALAQTTGSFGPVTGGNATDAQGGNADVIAKNSNGSTEASVEQLVILDIPAATALHLDVSTLVFDLNALDGDGWADRAYSGEIPEGTSYRCVYSLGDDTNPSGGFWGQTQVLPGGTSYQTMTYPNIQVAGTQVVNYPPVRIGADGELITNSKQYIVCYQTFILQLFSNYDYFDIQVSRNDQLETGERGIEHLYVQGNTCHNFGAGTGLYDLPDGQTRHLIPAYSQAGTTGYWAKVSGSHCDYTNSSWLDMLGVLAVKVNSDHHGENIARLTYTLISSDTAF